MDPQARSVMLSFVIVNWNAAAYLGGCLSSLRAETADRDVEVIVVDNNSSDGSAALVQRQFPWVRVIALDTNLGFAGANNLGMELAKGDLLFLVNPDVVFHEGAVDALVRTMQARREVGLVGPRVVSADGSHQSSLMGFPTLFTSLARACALDVVFPRHRILSRTRLGYRDATHEGPVEVVNGCFWCVRRTAVESVGMLDPRFFMYAEDVDWCKRFHDAGWIVYYQPAAVITHFGGGSSRVAPTRFYIEMRRAELQYARKHMSSAAVQLLRLIMVLHYATRFVLFSTRVSLARGPQRTLSRKRRSSVRSVYWLTWSAGQTEKQVDPRYYAPYRAS